MIHIRLKTRTTTSAFIWLAGLAVIYFFVPGASRSLRYQPGEYVFGFQSNSHVLVSIMGARKDLSPAIATADIRGAEEVPHDSLRPPVLLSPDSRLLAKMGKPERIDVFDARTGTKLTSLNTGKAPPSFSGPAGWASPIQFSLDGSLLVDNFGNVWELPSGRKRFQLPVGRARSSTFAFDCGAIASVREDGHGTWLVLNDAKTGVERQSFRLQDGTYLSTYLGRSKLIELITNVDTQPRWYEQLLARIPGLGYKAGTMRSGDWVLVEPETGRTVFRTRDRLRALSDDGKFVVTATADGPWTDDPDKDYTLWRLPLRKSIGTISVACLIWSAAFLVWCLARRRQSKS